MEELGLGDADDLEGNLDGFASLNILESIFKLCFEVMLCMSDVFMFLPYFTQKQIANALQVRYSSACALCTLVGHL